MILFYIVRLFFDCVLLLFKICIFSLSINSTWDVLFDFSLHQKKNHLYVDLSGAKSDQLGVASAHVQVFCQSV